jgi:hypothetical protein
MEYRWTAVDGRFTFIEGEIRFQGGTTKYGEETGPAYGTAICDQRFSGGSISATVRFMEANEKSTCDIVFYRDPGTQAFVSAGIGGEVLFGIRQFYGKWTVYTSGGNLANLESGTPYLIKVRVQGSRVRLFIGDVEVASTILPFTLPQSQVGLFCRDTAEVIISDYKVSPEAPRAFVVMQFSSPYNELYSEVIKQVCKDLGIEAKRADETYGPGLILADVTRQIDESKFVIAEITPVNPNVYYELGYAHARNKPTILIADKDLKQLPFDVSPFRTLFYQNTIEGKRKIEEGLRSHVQAILSETAIES